MRRLTKQEKRRLMAEGCRLGFKRGQQQLNENPIAGMAVAVGRALWPVIKWLAINVLPDLIREYGPKLVEKIKSSEDKEKTSKSAFRKMLYATLDKVPADKISELTAKALESSSKKINKELSQADGYVAPSSQEIEKMVQRYKAKKGA